MLYGIFGIPGFGFGNSLTEKIYAGHFSLTFVGLIDGVVGNVWMRAETVGKSGVNDMVPNKFVAAMVILVSMLLAACGVGADAPAETITPTSTPMGTLTAPPGATVQLTVEGPVPQEVTVKAGTPILFVLEDDTYGQSTVKFDDSRVGTMLWLLPGESRVFTRLVDKEPGIYTYEMLTRPDNKGSIIVE